MKNNKSVSLCMWLNVVLSASYTRASTHTRARKNRKNRAVHFENDGLY